MEGEVRFIRAFVYFEMMKRYGGVPLVDMVVDPFSPIDDKYVVRAKEEEIADFIDSECTAAIALIARNATPRGGVNKWAALMHCRQGQIYGQLPLPNSVAVAVGWIGWYSICPEQMNFIKKLPMRPVL